MCDLILYCLSEFVGRFKVVVRTKVRIFREKQEKSESKILRIRLKTITLQIEV